MCSLDGRNGGSGVWASFCGWYLLKVQRPSLRLPRDTAVHRLSRFPWREHACRVARLSSMQSSSTIMHLATRTGCVRPVIPVTAVARLVRCLEVQLSGNCPTRTIENEGLDFEDGFLECLVAEVIVERRRACRRLMPECRSEELLAIPHQLIQHTLEINSLPALSDVFHHRRERGSSRDES